MSRPPRCGHDGALVERLDGRHVEQENLDPFGGEDSDASIARAVCVPVEMMVASSRLEG